MANLFDKVTMAGIQKRIDERKRRLKRISSRDIFRDLTWGMNALDPLAGVMSDPFYYCSKENVLRGLSGEDPSVGVDMCYPVLRQMKPLLQAGFNDREYREFVESMKNRDKRIPIGIVAFNFGFPMFSWFFDMSLCSSLWDCPTSGWMVKRELINMAAELDGWEECDVCGIDLHVEDNYITNAKMYQAVDRHAIADWISDFVSEVYPRIMQDRCLATKKMLYMLFRGQEIAQEGSRATMRSLLGCVAFLTHLALYRAMGVVHDQRGRLREAYEFVCRTLEEIVRRLYEAFIVGNENTGTNICEYIYSEFDAQRLDVSPYMDSLLEEDNIVQVLISRHEDDFKRIARELLREYRRVVQCPENMGVFDDDARFCD